MGAKRVEQKAHRLVDDRRGEPAVDDARVAAGVWALLFLFSS